jgi:tight adherence protein B
VVESHLGRDLGEALRAMADRIGGEDFRWVVDAIEIHREVGGDLAEILQTVAETIRDRGQIRRRVKTLSAEGRLSGIVLMVLPIAVAILVSFTNPTYLTELTGSTAGQLMIAFGLGFMVMGALWIRRIVKIKF